MATSGDQDNSSSELDESDGVCLPCQLDGIQIAAVGYCVECKESLCQRCFDGHLIPSITRKHVLIAKESTHAHGAVTDEGNETFSRTCPMHDKEVINYHCPTHSFFGCQFCFYKHQKTCKDVKCIPEVCQDLTRTQEYMDLTEKLTRIDRKCTELAEKFKNKIQAIDSFHAKAVADIQDFKRDVLEEIEQIEINLIEKADIVKDEDSKKATGIVQRCDEVLKANREIASKIEHLQKSGDQTDLYIAMIESNDKLKTVGEELIASADGIRIRSLSFKGNRGLIQTLNKSWELRKCYEKDAAIEKFEYELDVNIKSETDESDCRPIGSVICSNILVLTDGFNRSVKLVDAKRKNVLSELKLSSEPLGVCKISDTQVAVAQQDKIVFANTEPTLNIEREFAVETAYHGIAYHDKKLVVSYSGGQSKVEVLDMQGNILKTVKADKRGQPLFREPYNVAIDNKTSLIYVSDYYSNTVSCMKFDGTVVATYVDKELKSPWQVIVDNFGLVYVCGQTSHNIHQITAECKKVKILLTKADGLNLPESISFDEDQGKLIIGGQNSNKLKVFCAKYANP